MKQPSDPNNKKTHTQDLVTVVGTNYIDLIIPDLLEKCFEVYRKTEFDKKQFQVSVFENTFATAGIILAVLAFEAYRNRIFYLENKKVSKYITVPKDLASIFKTKDASFPENCFENLLNEVFVIRDVIVHNHIYKVNVEFDDDWQMLGHRQKLLEGYGDDKKFKAFTSSRTKKTTSLKLNIQTGKIGFEDLFLVLVMFDLFIGLSEKILSRPYVPFHFWKEINGVGADKLYQYLTHFYNLIPNAKYLQQLDPVLQKIRTEFVQYLPDYKEYFINNICIKCGEFGFRQMNDIYLCKKCGHKFELHIINSQI